MNDKLTEEEAAAGLEAIFGDPEVSPKTLTMYELSRMTKTQLVEHYVNLHKRFSDYIDHHDEEMEKFVKLKINNDEMFSAMTRRDADINLYRAKITNYLRNKAELEKEIEHLKKCLVIQEGQIDDGETKYQRLCIAVHDLTEKYL